MQQIGERYGVFRQTVQQRLASIGSGETARPPRHTLIDKNRLEFLYRSERLSIDKIGAAFGVSAYTIYRSLEFYKIPRRTTLRLNSKYIDVIRRLQDGEAAEIECAARKPYVVLHKSANRAGAKISVRKLGDGKFKITKISRRQIV